MRRHPLVVALALSLGLCAVTATNTTAEAATHLAQAKARSAQRYLLALATQLVLFPQLGLEVSLGENLLIGSVFTLVSLVSMLGREEGQRQIASSLYDYVKVGGVWCYVYRVVDQFGQVIDIYVSRRRDLAAAECLFAHRAFGGRGLRRLDR